MNADELAKQFYEQGLVDKWLSVNRTKYLYDLASKNKQVDGQTYTAYGTFTDNDGNMHSWSMWRAPNHAGVFKIVHSTPSNFQQIEDQKRAEFDTALDHTINVITDAYKNGEITEEQYNKSMDSIERQRARYRPYSSNPSTAVKTIAVGIAIIVAIVICNRK